MAYVPCWVKATVHPEIKQQGFKQAAKALEVYGVESQFAGLTLRFGVRARHDVRACGSNQKG